LPVGGIVRWSGLCCLVCRPRWDSTRHPRTHTRPSLSGLRPDRGTSLQVASVAAVRVNRGFGLSTGPPLCCVSALPLSPAHFPLTFSGHRLLSLGRTQQAASLGSSPHKGGLHRPVHLRCVEGARGERHVGVGAALCLSAAHTQLASTVIWGCATLPSLRQSGGPPSLSLLLPVGVSLTSLSLSARPQQRAFGSFSLSPHARQRMDSATTGVQATLLTLSPGMTGDRSRQAQGSDVTGIDPGLCWLCWCCTPRRLSLSFVALPPHNPGGLVLFRGGSWLRLPLTRCWL